MAVHRPAWLSGPIAGVAPALLPVAHALVQVQVDVRRLLDVASEEDVVARPYDIASVGFHVRHLAGSLDRLFTYARGEALSPEQLATLESEKTGRELSIAELRALIDEAIGHALDQLRGTPDATLDEAREVGRLRLPSTVRGLLFHAAEHSARHRGQAITTLKVVQGERRSADTGRTEP